MSDTPRTDNHMAPICPQCGYSCSAVRRDLPSIEFTCQLEHELEQARAELREAREISTKYEDRYFSAKADLESAEAKNAELTQGLAASRQENERLNKRVRVADELTTARMRLVEDERLKVRTAEAQVLELSAKCAGMAELLTRIKIWRCDDSNANEDWDYLPEIIEILSNLHAHTQDIIAVLEAARWIPVSERLPESPKADNHEYETVLVRCPEYPDAWLGYYIPMLNEWRINGSPSRWNVTHWMPMPAPPNVR